MSQLSLFGIEANNDRAVAEFGNLIGRRVTWMRLYSIENPPKRATVFVERRRCEGVVVRVGGGAEDYAPRLIVSDGDLEWWLPLAEVELLPKATG